MELNDRKLFRCTNLSSVCFDTFREMKLKGELCDVVLKCEDNSFVVHSIIIAAAIPYFRIRLSTDFATLETGGGMMGIITMEHIDPCALESLIDFAYSHEIEITASNAISLLSAASVLDIDQVQDACIEFLTERMSHPLSSSKLAALKANLNMFPNFNMVPALESFLGTPSDDACEDELVKTIEEKFSFDEGESSKEEKVFDLPQKLSSISRSPSKILTENRSSSYKSTPPGLYLISEESSLIMQYFNSETKEWVTTKTPPILMCTGTATEMNGSLYFIDRGTLRVYDPLNNVWSMKFGLFPPRLCVQATSLNDMLYICSRTDDDSTRTFVECLNIQEDKYFVVASTSGPRSLCGIVALDDCLYVIGGKYGFDSACDFVDKYNPDTEQWTMLSPMLDKRCDFGCATMNGKIYVCGGMKSNNENDILSSAEVYDPDKNEWKLISSMKTARCKFVLLSYCGKLYAVGGNIFKNDVAKGLLNMEVYNPEIDEWQDGPPINDAYSYVAGVSVFYTP